METRSIRVSARITPSLYQKINRLALKKKWSLSDVTEEALIAYLK